MMLLIVNQAPSGEMIYRKWNRNAYWMSTHGENIEFYYHRYIEYWAYLST